MQCLAARADVAQLVEQRFRKPQVTGSNPVVGSSLSFATRWRAKAAPRRSPTEPNRLLASNFVASYGLAGTRLRIVGVGRWNAGDCGAACSRRLSESACRRQVER
jgi:hypothetical protein